MKEDLLVTLTLEIYQSSICSLSTNRVCTMRDLSNVDVEDSFLIYSGTFTRSTSIFTDVLKLNQISFSLDNTDVDSRFTK